MLHRLKLALLGLALFGTSAAGVRTYSMARGTGIALTPVMLDPSDPNRIEVGELRFVKGWAFKGQNERFGGISALVVLPDGRFLGISDAGDTIGLNIDTQGRTVPPFLAVLPGTKPGSGYSDRDSESATYDPESGQLWVGYEQRPAIRRFSRGLARLEATVRPAEMQHWPSNGGLEALVRLRDGRFLAMAEVGDGPVEGSRDALLFPGDPTMAEMKPIRFGYRPPSGYRVTDAAELPDGRIILLQRRLGINGFTAAISVADPGRIEAGKVWQGREIARLEPPLTVDNMEGIAVTREAGQTIIWLVSDDNFSALQRTLLLKFALVEAPDTRKPEASAPGFSTIR